MFAVNYADGLGATETAGFVILAVTWLVGLAVLVAIGWRDGKARKGTFANRNR